MAKDAIKIFNTFGELVRTYTEDESDERSDYAEKAQEFLSKHPGYTTDGTVTAEEPAPTDPASDSAPLGSAAPKGKGKGSAAPKGKE